MHASLSSVVEVVFAQINGSAQVFDTPTTRLKLIFLRPIRKLVMSNTATSWTTEWISMLPRAFDDSGGGLWGMIPVTIESLGEVFEAFGSSRNFMHRTHTAGRISSFHLLCVFLPEANSKDMQDSHRTRAIPLASHQAEGRNLSTIHLRRNTWIQPGTSAIDKSHYLLSQVAA
ncbi:uncharacterized protein BDR25DRAFT_308572 [Lindgomyces ingoldianus]|uniref:Uncharacterized protein n=1 Tax=Lindgomyces ingoldianus TaxID=673940 RepID=A0ACB6REI0_9PLEO|nr:uncharacterized protein BDR25DRAFT_308572 [Lindgomyces ingoldianus]KAF2477688.1 hypothetical protein BDR25DRAFT_308572 [Lindgomyces ingoldianus]